MSAVEMTLLGEQRRTVGATPALDGSRTLAVRLDALARLAARMVGVPMGMVALASPDNGRRLGRHGVRGARQTTLGHDACLRLAAAAKPVRIDDLRSGHVVELPHSRTMARHGLCAMLAVPLRDPSGKPVGTLAVFDARTRNWSTGEVNSLVEVASVVDAPAGGEKPAGSDPFPDSLLEAVQEAIIAIDGDDRVVGWNRGAEELFGHPAQLVLGRRIDELLDLGGAGHDGTPLSTVVLQAPHRWRTPHRLTARHGDGQLFAAMASFAVVYQPDGPLVCAFVTDVSAQAAAEEDAERQRGFLDALVNNLDVGVAASDAQGRLVFMNPALRRAHGLPEQWSGTQPEELAASTGSGTDSTALFGAESAIRSILRGGEVRDVAAVIKAPGQPPRDYTLNGRPIIDLDGELLGAVVTIDDVTTRRRMDRFRECQLRSLQALAEASTADEAAPAIVRAVADTLGWPHTELWLVDQVTGTLQVAAHWTAPGLRLDDLFGSTVVKGLGISGTVWATGEPLWVPDIGDTPLLATEQARERARVCAERGLHTVLAVPINDGEQVLGVLSCYADTPEYDQEELTHHLAGVAAQVGQFLSRRRAEELAMQLARAKDDFITLVGHEMRTPLTSVASYIELLRDGDDRDDTERQMLAAVARNTATLRAIIDDLLDLAGLESGHLGITVRQVDLVDVVTESTALMVEQATTAGIRLHLDLPDRLAVEGDPDRLRQVAGNLLSNAVKYSPHGGDLTVRLRERNGAAELGVTDSGIGIPAEERQHLFRRFYRAANAKHSGIPGTGLGLTIVRTIVQAHHGTIAVSHHQPGTTVTVRLPLRGDAAPLEQAAPGQPGPDARS